MTAASDDGDGVPGDVRERIRQAILRLEARGTTPSVRVVRKEAEVGAKAAEKIVRAWRAGTLDLSKPWGEAAPVPAVVERDAKPQNALVVAAEARRAAAAVEVAEDPVRDALETLRNTTDPLAMARAGATLAARRVASAYERGDVARELDGLKKCLEELRRSEQGYLEIGKERGTLIARDVAIVVLGSLATRACAVLGLHEVRLAAEVERWLHNENFRALTSEERARKIRAWAQENTFELRTFVSEEPKTECEHCNSVIYTTETRLGAAIDRMIAAEVKTRAAEKGSVNRG